MTVFLVYLWGISEQFKTTFLVLSIVLGVAMVARYIARFIQADEGYQSCWSERTKKEDRDKIRNATVPGPWHIGLFIVCLVLTCIIPNRLTIAMMYIVPRVEKAAPSTETMSKEGREMYDMVKEYMGAVVKKKVAEATGTAETNQPAENPPSQK